MQAAEVVHLFWHEAVEEPAFLPAEGIKTTDLGLSEKEAQDPKQVAQAFLQTYGAKLQIAETANRWHPIRTEVDDLGNYHVFSRQIYNDLRVFAGEIAVHISKGAVTAANGEYLSAVGVSPKPALSVDAAYKIALNQLGLDNPALIDSELVIYNPALLDAGPSANHLAYYLIISLEGTPASYTAFVDAHTGKLLLKYNNLQTGKDRDVRDLNSAENLPGRQCYTEAGPVGTPSADCLSAFNFTGATYDYFANTHGRDSFDDNGATMLVSVRFGTEANAFWNGFQTAFGPGFATKDVVAHEWTHAVTQYTANLEYVYQSGALNESVSDIFGAMVDRDDWLMGEDTPVGAIRSLSDPTEYGQPGKVSDNQFYCGSDDYDNGGVHQNSGVPNHAAYLMAEGGTYNERTVTGVGRGPTERIFYRALTNYLTSGSGFNDAYNALIGACHDLYSSDSDTCTNVMLAAQAAELNDPVCSDGGGTATPDSYEDDDIFSQASTITVDGDAQPHNFHDAGDNDWVQFSATPDTSYVIETFYLGRRSDTYMYLYDRDGTTVITENDDGGSGRASRIEWTAPITGTYYIRLHHYSGSTFGADTDYNLRVTSDSSGGGSGTPDAYEPDDAAGQASTLTVNGSAQRHNFHAAGDHDWLKFPANAGTSYVIETLNLGLDSDTILDLYDTNGTTLLASDDDSGSGYASRIEWIAPVSGIYYVRARHYYPGAFGANTNYDLRVTSSGVTPDSYEPDDSAGQASTLTVNGAAQSHNFHDAGDHDWAKFAATAGCGYTIETSNLGSNSDTVLRLYNTDGATLIAEDDDGGADLASQIAWTAPANGTYYVRVHHYSNFAYGSDTRYDLQMSDTDCGTATPDAYEPDDTAGQASSITVGGSAQTHNFHVAGDLDWAKFSATAGIDYVIETSNLGSDSDTVLELYATDGVSLIISNDDGGTGLASRIAWTAPANGTYYIRVRHYGSSQYGPDTHYDLRVTGTGTPGTPDAYESDDTAGQASAITVDGAAQTHNFHAAGDHDWAKFSATAGTSYIIETLNLGSRSDTVLTLYDPDGATVITEDDDGGAGVASRIGWTALATDTYYVRVHHYAGDTFGANTEYDLRVMTAIPGGADAYEPDDSAAQASTITVDGAAQTHNFHVPGDHDWVAFTATAGAAHTIRTFNLGSGSDTYLDLYDTDATTLLASNDDGGGGLASLITWTPPISGVYYVRVRHYTSGASGADTNYDLQVVSSGVGDADAYEPDDSAVQASTITVDGAAQTHNFHYAGDHDWVAFSATAGTSYVIETLNLGSRSDTYLYLYDTNAATLIAQDDDGGSGFASRIEWTAPTNGVYYTQVRHFNTSTYGADTNYDLQITSAGCVGGDSYEPDDAAGLASSIATDGTVQTHNFFCPGDNDWVAFSATVGTNYVIETLNLGSRSDTYLYLYGADATTIIDQNDDGGSGFASRIEWVAPASDTYYIRVRHYASSVYGTNTEYDLRVMGTDTGAPDAYEPDNDHSQANPIATDGTAQTHNFHAVNEEDWVSFSATVGTCVIETLNLGSRSDTVLELYNATPTLLARNDDGGAGLASRIVYSVLSSGTYYARIYHYHYRDIYGVNTNYDLQVTCSDSSGPDLYEPDDAPPQASELSVNGAAQLHNFHAPDDNDWSGFRATAGTYYVIETLNLDINSDTVLELYAPDGVTFIAMDDDSGAELFASRLAWIAPVDGFYYVRVYHFAADAYGPDTGYELRVTAAASSTTEAATAELTARAAQLGDAVEAIVYIQQPVSAVKVEALAKPAYLNLVEATPLSADGKALSRKVTADTSRWQMVSAKDGRTSVWYAGKATWDGGATYPALRLRWQLTTPLPDHKLTIPVRLTTIDQNGQANTETIKLTAVMLGSNPKIDDVQPRSLTNDTDNVISLMGSGFVNKPKVYLQSGDNQIQLTEVTFDNSELVWATVPAGVKPGLYKVRLVNPDDSSAEFAGDITITAPACYDFDQDGQVDVEDIQTVAGRWRNPSLYEARYDVVFDQTINIRDIMTVQAQWGAECTP